MGRLRFPIKAKIFLGIMIPALMLVFVVYLDYVNLTALGRSAEQILSKNYKTIRAAQQIRQSLETRQNRFLMPLFLDREVDWGSLGSIQEISDLLDVCKENITERGEAEIIGILVEEVERYRDLSGRISSALGGSPPDRSDGTYYELISLTGAMISHLNELVLLNERAMEKAEGETKAMAGRAMQYSLGLLVSAILFSLILSYLLASRISRPLTELARNLAIVKKGTGRYPRIPVKSRDEIGFLTAEFNRLVERLRAFDQRSADRLAAEQEKVHQAEEAKARFIADLSHQLKTPMTSLTMSVGILSEKARERVGEKYGQLMETAREDCVRLSALINELVDIAKLDAMLKPRTREVLDLEKVIQGSVRPLLYQAEERGVEIETEIEPDLPFIAIDSLRFPWVITNLAGNAIRYTARGGRVVLRVRREGERVTFQCADNGNGIEEKYLPRIFDRYTQFSERENSGIVGLGLAIVKEIIEQHGGDITVESKVGEGTTFTFWIPIQDEGIHEKDPSHR